ncbi:hypothetical protein J8273_8753 [Carpediemonas membranifera]|uniref:Uncharacterized protein n=1 Tax=Carpediemonas membranifera TaxID=201153 RepID=A0A8J6AP37_9EUKA|nr:hypothetical protein J8273_8753 [Carpediemonas membranifera]|eukprot:KAG9389461.1 hypothetical protein J8273_8753 [Carpediemonas membranifera]
MSENFTFEIRMTPDEYEQMMRILNRTNPEYAENTSNADDGRYLKRGSGTLSHSRNQSSHQDALSPYLNSSVPYQGSPSSFSR